MKIEPLTKKLYSRAKEAGINKITLNFSGGSDEGYLSVTLNEGLASDHALENEIEEWAWEAYEYCGAGDGNSYGDDISYDLTTMKATIADWFTARQDGAEYDSDFTLEDDDSEEFEDETYECEDSLKTQAQSKLLQCLVQWAATNEECVSEELIGIIEHAKQLTESER